MNWLKRQLRNWINSDNCAITGNAISPMRIQHDFDDSPIRFSVTMARGGVVIASNVYDRSKDRNNCIIHVVHDDEDVAAKIGQIVAMELIKQ
jgi:hypothetical protein